MEHGPSRTRLRPTGTGIGVVIGAVSAATLALATGYTEFAAIAIVGVLLVVGALAWPRVISRASFQRVNPPRLVGRTDVVQVVLNVETPRAAPPATVVDQMAGLDIPIALPPLQPGRPVSVRYGVRALRRGVHQLGPLMEERTDPLGLVTRSAEYELVDEVLVHPRIHRLGIAESGSRTVQSRARVPRLSDDPLADFRSLREYVIGDDERLVHWPTFARTGTLMVRDHFELRRTTRTVILETLDRSITEAGFEDAAEIAASIVCESFERNISVAVRSRDEAQPGRAAPLVHRVEALEFFARVRRTTAADTLKASALRVNRANSDQVFLVAGAASPLIAQLSSAASIRRQLVVVRLSDRSAPLPRLASRCIDVASAEEFVAAWNRALVA